MDIENNLRHIKENILDNVKLIAVSKTKPIELIYQAYNCGQRDFGENKALELRDKAELLPKDIQWHFIGHLQTNKVKYIIPSISLIHSVDSLKLMKEIEKQSSKFNKTTSCLLQIDIANEENKFGFDLKELKEVLNTTKFKGFKNLKIIGVMGMGSITEDKNKTKSEFAQLKDYFNKLKQEFFADNNDFKEISMGMSEDYPIAINEGSTMVRIGSKIFGERDYNNN